MRVHSEVEISAAADRVRPYLNDLSRYGEWMPLVHSVETAETGPAPAWDVELRAKVGPLARSKKLRMKRITNELNRIVFERAENDGRHHSPWVLTIDVSEIASGVLVGVTLEYGGSLWTGGILDKLLAANIAAGRDGLRKLFS